MASACTPLERPAAPTNRREARLFTRLFKALEFRCQRRRLAALDDHLLADIGISREDAEAEAAMRLWDVPRHWQR